MRVYCIEDGLLSVMSAYKYILRILKLTHSIKHDGSFQSKSVGVGAVATAWRVRGSTDDFTEARVYILHTLSQEQ